MAKHFRTDAEAAAWLHKGMQRAMVEGTKTSSGIWLAAWLHHCEQMVEGTSELQRAVNLMQCASSFRFTLDPYQDKYLRKAKS